VQYANPELLKQLAAPTQDEKDEDLDGMILDSCFQERTTTIGRGIQWVMVDRVELTAGQVIDRLTGMQNPARQRAAKLWETQQARRMTTVLTRFSDKNKGQRNGYTIKRRKLKDEHYVYILEKTFPTSNNGDTPKTGGLAGLVSRME